MLIIVMLNNIMVITAIISHAFPDTPLRREGKKFWVFDDI